MNSLSCFRGPHFSMSFVVKAMAISVGMFVYIPTMSNEIRMSSFSGTTELRESGIPLEFFSWYSLGGKMIDRIFENVLARVYPGEPKVDVMGLSGVSFLCTFGRP